jgi:hypothetical protein
MERMIDYLASRQAAGLGTDRNELNAKLDTLVRHFGIGWLTAGGSNPLQKLWASKHALATNELLNLGDAIEGLETVDNSWLDRQVGKIKNGDQGNRAGAIFELLALNMFLSSGNSVRPSRSNSPGFDGVVDLPDSSSLLVSIKNHGTTSYEQDFRRHAKDLDDHFARWLKRHSLSAELRIFCSDNISSTGWASLKKDIQHILDGQLDGTAKDVNISGQWTIILKNIDSEYAPLSTRNVSSVFFICAKEHKNEQVKFIEDLRKDCSNLVKHTGDASDDALRVLFVRLGGSAPTQQCSEWARDYFVQFPHEKVGIIVLYQAAVVNSKEQTSLSHYILPIEGPQFADWSHPTGKSARRLPDLSVLVGVNIAEASKKVIQTDSGQIPLEGMYTYQRGDIYRSYKFREKLQCVVSNPAPGIKIHSEIETDDGMSFVMQMIASEQSELLLLP